MTKLKPIWCAVRKADGSQVRGAVRRKVRARAAFARPLGVDEAADAVGLVLQPRNGEQHGDVVLVTAMSMANAFFITTHRY